MSNQYTQPPPSYRPSSPYKDTEAASPLLGNSSYQGGAGPSSGNAIYDQPAQGDIPDDFKYGVNVSDSSPEIRKAFIRKVYSILLAQIFATVVVAGVISRSPNTINWLINNSWAIFLPTIATFINLGVLYWKRHSHPINLILLSTFTLLEASTLGFIVAFYDTRIVLQALLITLGVFLGLTAFTFQSKYDFSGMGPWLFAVLMAMVMTGFVHMFIPFGKTMDLIYSGVGVLLFSAYIVYDTFEINKRLSPDEYIMGAISLYLDLINLFLHILRLLNNANDN